MLSIVQIYFWSPKLIRVEMQLQHLSHGIQHHNCPNLFLHPEVYAFPFFTEPRMTQAQMAKDDGVAPKDVTPRKRSLHRMEVKIFF